MKNIVFDSNKIQLTPKRMSHIFDAISIKKDEWEKESVYFKKKKNVATYEGSWLPFGNHIEENKIIKKQTIIKVLNKIEHLKLAAPRLLFSKNRDSKREFNFLVKEINTLINNPDMRFACRVQVDRISDYNLDKSRCIKESQVKFYIINTKTGMVESESE